MRRALVAALMAVLTGCITPPSPSQRLLDSAFEMNHATRFGRIDLALEQVGAAARDDFARRHAAWGRSIRVVDVELTGIRWIDRSQADVSLQVSWQRTAEMDLRDTQLSQRWRQDEGQWRMTSEQRVSGSAGLFNEPAARDGKGSGDEGVAASAPKRPSYFRTRVIAGE